MAILSEPSSDGEPAPDAATFYVTGGTIPPDAPSYVPRQADKDLLRELRRGGLCYVLNARQMGKSSLSIRTRAALTADGVRTVFLDCQKFGTSATAEQWYRSLLERIGHDLKLRPAMLAYWKDNQERTPVDRLFGAIRDVALEPVASPLVIFIDEIDVVRELRFDTDEFFGAIRSCFNARVEDEAYGRVAFCLLGTVAPADLISDVRLSPFNVGTRIRLSDFTPDEAAPLASRLPGGRTSLNRVLWWTSGHPYLTQRLCAELAKSGSRDVDRACAALFFSKSDSEVDENIKNVRNAVLRSGNAGIDRTDLLLCYGQVVGGKRVPDDDTDAICAALRLSGLVRSEGGLLRVRNRIYGRIFDGRWVRDNVPSADVRRVRIAVARVLLPVSVIGLIVCFHIGVFVWEGWYKRIQVEPINSAVEANKPLVLKGIGIQGGSVTFLDTHGNILDSNEPITMGKPEEFSTLGNPGDPAVTRGSDSESNGYEQRADLSYGSVAIPPYLAGKDIHLIVARGSIIPYFAGIFKYWCKTEVHIIKRPAPRVILGASGFRKPGEQIVLSGSGFGRPGQVLLNNRILVSVQRWDDHSITFTVPAYLPEGDYMVTIQPEYCDVVNPAGGFSVLETPTKATVGSNSFGSSSVAMQTHRLAVRPSGTLGSNASLIGAPTAKPSGTFGRIVKITAPPHAKPVVAPPAPIIRPPSHTRQVEIDAVPMVFRVEPRNADGKTFYAVVGNFDGLDRVLTEVHSAMGSISMEERAKTIAKRLAILQKKDPQWWSKLNTTVFAPPVNPPPVKPTEADGNP
jgi:hypothetical protein